MVPGAGQKVSDLYERSLAPGDASPPEGSVGEGCMARKIRVRVFDDLRQSLADAGAYEHGKPVNLRTWGETQSQVCGENSRIRRVIKDDRTYSNRRFESDD